MVASALPGKTYRVALQGKARGDSYRTCPDFRKNTLGTCKHVFKVQARVAKRFSHRNLAKRWVPDRFAVFARYDGALRLGLQAPPQVFAAIKPVIARWKDRIAGTDAQFVDLFETVRKLIQQGEEVTVFPDAEEVLDQAMHQHRMAEPVKSIRRNPGAHPLRTQLLKTELLPYQLDGIAFAAGAGRAVLADEMGLGKTIQGVGVAELLAREAWIRRGLIVCPASLKSQWRAEINR